MMKFVLIVLIFVGIEINKNFALENPTKPCYFHEEMDCNPESEYGEYGENMECGLKGKCTNTRIGEQ